MTPNHQHERLAYTVNEFKQVSGLSHTTVYKLLKLGKLQSSKVLGRRMILAESARRLFEAQSVTV